MKKIILSIKLFFPFILFSFLCLILAPMESSAKDQGFFIGRNKNKQLTIESTPITIFSTKDKIIYPGSQGSSKFVIKNNNQESMNYELILTTSSSKNITLPLEYVLSSNGNDWTVSADDPAKTGQSLSVKQVIFPGKTEEYTLLWKWESNDQQDQKIQALSLDKALYENLHFKLVVEENNASVPSTDSSDSTNTTITTDNSTTSASNSPSTTSDGISGASETNESTSNNQNDSSKDSSQAGSVTNPSSTNKTTFIKAKVLPLMGEIVSDVFHPLVLLLIAAVGYLWFRKRQDS